MAYTFLLNIDFLNNYYILPNHISPRLPAMLINNSVFLTYLQQIFYHRRKDSSSSILHYQEMLPMYLEIHLHHFLPLQKYRILKISNIVYMQVLLLNYLAKYHSFHYSPTFFIKFSASVFKYFL